MNFSVTLQILITSRVVHVTDTVRPAVSKLSELILFTNWVSGFMMLCEVRLARLSCRS